MRKNSVKMLGVWGQVIESMEVALLFYEQICM